MNIITFTLALAAGSVAAGFLGALTGLGGGGAIVPLLVLLFGVDIRYAIGASLVSVIATSSGAAAAYVREGYSNIRVGMFLEIATTIGALSGAMVAAKVSTSGLATVDPDMSRFRPHHWATAAMLAGAVAVFGYLLVDSLQYADRLLLRIQVLEGSQPPLR